MHEVICNPKSILGPCLRGMEAPKAIGALRPTLQNHQIAPAGPGSTAPTRLQKESAPLARSWAKIKTLQMKIVFPSHTFYYALNFLVIAKFKGAPH